MAERAERRHNAQGGPLLQEAAFRVAGPLAPATQHFWRIVVRNKDGAEVSSPIWQFGTGGPTEPTTCPGTPSVVDADGYSYADRDVLFSRQPGTGNLFAVFLSPSGVVELGANEEVVDLRRTHELYEAHGDGSADASGELDVDGLDISPDDSAGQLSQLYVIFVES